MPGTIAGGKKAAMTNRAEYGEDFYRRIGAMGGANGKTGGFAANPELARIAGAKGGRRSRRTYIELSDEVVDAFIETWNRSDNQTEVGKKLSMSPGQLYYRKQKVEKLRGSRLKFLPRTPRKKKWVS